MTGDQVKREPVGLAVVHEVRTSTDVHDSLGQGIVQRNERVAVTRDARLVAEGFTDGVTEHDRDILDGVVSVDLHVTFGTHREVGQGVLRERREHVIVERDAGVDRAGAGAIEVKAQLDARLARGSRDRCGAAAAHARESIDASASRNAVVSSAVPADTRRLRGMPMSRTRMPRS